MATDFALFLRRFLTAYLAGLRGCSPNTVGSYRDAFKLLIVFFRDERSIPPELYVNGAWSVPSPLPKSTATTPLPQSLL